MGTFRDNGVRTPLQIERMQRNLGVGGLCVRRALKSSSDLGAFIVPGFVYLRLTNIECNFMGYAKQAGSK